MLPSIPKFKVSKKPSTAIINIPNGLDPDECVKQDGDKPFLQALKDSEKLMNFHFDNYPGDLMTTSGKSTFVNEVLMELVDSDSIRRN